MKKIVLILASAFMLTSCIYEDYHNYPPSGRRPPYYNGNGRPPGNSRPPRPERPNNGGPHHNGNMGGRPHGRH